jgi:hypothetical protein
MKRRRRASNDRRRSDLGQVIARRILAEQGAAEGKIVVSIGLPRPDTRKGGDWECPFLIEGIGNSEIQNSFGADAMQALMLAFQGIRVTLEQSGRDLFWVNPEMGTDFPLNVPTIWGKQLVERVRLAIERETVRVWRARIKTGKTKIRGEEAKLGRQGTEPGEIAKAFAERKTDLERWEAEIDNLKPGWSIPSPPADRRKR